MVMLLASCSQAVLQTDYDYTLLLQTDELSAVSSDDPLYQQFEEVLAEPFLQELFSLYTATAKGLIVDAIPSRNTKALARKPVFILGAIEPGVHQQVSLRHNGQHVMIELAIGLGGGDPFDIDRARDQLPSALAEMLMVIMGVDQPDRNGQNQPAIYDLTTPEQALWSGFAASLEARYGQRHPEPWPFAEIDENMNQAAIERLMRYREIPINGLRYLYENGQPTNVPRTYDQGLRTPGVVASFFFKLWDEASDMYSQGDMVWFANYESSQIKGAKILLALNRMPRRPAPSLETFVQSYCETFPAECATVQALMHDIVGASGQ